MSETVTLRVGDMSCGHCAATIRKAIEAALPGSAATVDPQSKRVEVAGTGDAAAVRAAVTAAGYTPSEA